MFKVVATGALFTKKHSALVKQMQEAASANQELQNAMQEQIQQLDVRVASPVVEELISTLASQSV